MKAEIISIGTELLLGHIINTNASYLSERLAESGIDVYYHTTVGDNHSRLAQALKQAITRSDIVITSGGLGPTVDDITVEAVSRLTPERVKQIKNHVGTAPGLFIKYEGKTIICLPGPPREIVPMFEHSVMPYIKKMAGGWTIKSRTIKTTGLAESQVNGMVKDLLNLKPPTTVGIYAKLKEVDLKIMTKAESERCADRVIKKIENKIRSRLKDHIFGYDDEILEDAVANILFKKKKTIAVAESCTGGLISNRLTNVNGSSKYFIMGVVAYSNLVKIAGLGVKKTTLKKYGAVSRNAAIEMAEGIRRLAGSDIGIGVTGIAGPTGGIPPSASPLAGPRQARSAPGGAKSKPVGLVYIALLTSGKRLVKEFRFKGSRFEIKFQASQVALDLLRRNI